MERTVGRELTRDVPNLLQALYQIVERMPEKPALRQKVEGSWREISYAELGERVKQLAAGLSNLGVGRGDRLALMSENCPEWPISDFAIQSLGAVTVPVYPTLEPTQIEHILNDSDARAVIVANEEKLERVRRIEHDFPIIVIDESFDNEDEKTMRFASLMASGEERPKDDWREGWEKLTRQDPATVIYTSGTTGRPKGAALSHGNFLANLEGIRESVPSRSEDVFLSLLPLSHVFERTSGQYLALTQGSTVCYAESMEKVPENLREVQPNVVPSVPRLYEKMYDRVQQQISESSALRQSIFRAAIAAGRERYRLMRRGRKPGGWLNLKLRLFDRLVFEKIRAATGGNLRFFVSGGAKLNQEIGEFFYAAGIPILEGYGLTETSPVIAVNVPGDEKFGTVGPPLSNVEVRIGEGDEIQTRGPNVMRSYLNRPDANREAFTEDGWYRTGDAGRLDEDGRLEVTERLKNIMVLSTGKNVAPQPIETQLVTMPNISQAILLGDGRKYVSALIVPDYDAVRRRLSTSESNDELSRNGEVRDLVQQDIDRACENFAAYERPKQFVLLPEELTQEAGELTPTLKVKMNVVRDRYSDAIEGVYAESRV